CRPNLFQQIPSRILSPCSRQMLDRHLAQIVGKALVASPTVSARASTGVAAAAGTIPATTRFLGTCLIHLQGAAFNIHAVEFTDGFGGVVSRSHSTKPKPRERPVSR